MPKKALESMTESMFYTLLALLWGPKCGIEIAAFTDKLTKGRVQLGPGTLYTILSRFLECGYLREVATEGRKRTYALTEEGRMAYVSELGLDGSVVFTGHTSFPELLARYRTADVFVCMSEHEGFCVPMLEAMHFGKPIVAYRAAAIPDTVGKGALLLDTKDPETAAAAIHRVLNDRDLRNALLVEQQKQLEKYSYDRVRKQLFTCLTGQEG